MVSTPCFAEKRISSYTDENGNKVYTTEEQSPATPPKPQYRSPVLDYRESAKQRDAADYERKSILHKKSGSQDAFDSNPTPVTPQVNPMNPQALSRPFNSLIDTFIHQLAFMLTIGIMLFILWLVALIDILKSEFAGSNKMIWFLTVTFLPLLGSVLYFIIGRGQKVTHHEPPDNEPPDGQELNIRSYNKPEI
jgi:hypothetical protein